MTVTELKQYIYKENKIEYVLEQIGCGHITYHQNKEYYSASNYDGDNRNAINVENNEYLNCKNYTRQDRFDNKSDLITLVQYNRHCDFIEAIKYLHKLFGLELTYKKSDKSEVSIDPLDVFKRVKQRKHNNVLDVNPMDEDALNDFVPYIHIDWFKEGIAPWAVEKFGLAYSYKYKRNVIPLRYWLDGRLLGFNMRTTVENYELFDIKKYYITPSYQKHLNLFGLWENRESIHKAGYVVIFESEKSVLKRYSLGDGTGAALQGHSISEEQVRILIGLNVQIVVALDKDISRQEVRHMCEKFYGIRSIYYIWDKYDLLKEKDSPADASNKIYEYLLQYKVKYDEHEHNDYIKELNKKDGALLGRKTTEELNELKKKLNTKTLWSWSRYNTYKTSPYEYFLKYIIHKEEDRKDNIYSVMGGLGHDIMEKLYAHEINHEDMDGLFEDAWMTAQIAELKFDRSDSEKNKKISDKYYRNLKHFFSHHKMIPYKLQTEQFITIKIGTHFFQGYLDGCFKDDNGIYTILDFKTSTIYKGEKAQKECGQLLLYAIGLSQMGIPLDKIRICWNFLKYVNVQCEQANGKITTREIERSEIGEKLHSNAKMWLKKLGYEEDMMLYLDSLVQTNSIDCLPEDVKAKFEISDCYVYVEITEELTNNMIKEVMEMIYEIGIKETSYTDTCDDEIWWESPEDVKKQSYYFANLCGYSANLHLPYKKYLETLEREKSGNVFGGVGSNTDNEDDLSWLNDL